MIPKFSQLEHLQRNSREILLIQQQKEKEKFIRIIHSLICYLAYFTLHMLRLHQDQF